LLVTAIDQADGAVVGAVGPALKRSFHLSNAGLGLLAGSVSIAAAVATVPAGTLVDRVRRGRVLGAAVASWTAAMAFTGAASTFAMLLAARLCLGAVRAAAAPVSTSLVGDLYAPKQRARIFGYLEGAQLAGTGIGFLIAAAAVASLSWRWGFWALGGAGALLTVPAWRLPEPARASADSVGADATSATAVGRRATLTTVIDLLRIRTNLIVMCSAAVADFFSTAVATFGVVFVTRQYGISTARADLGLPVIGVAALAAVVVGGGVGDHLKRTGRGREQLAVAAGCYGVAAAALVPAALTHALWLAIPTVMLAAAAITAPSPMLDAIRVDIVHPAMRGRAESLRTLFRTGVSAAAPVTIGLAATHVGGGGHAGLRDTLVATLPVVLMGSGVLLLLARRSYDADVDQMTTSLE
jgi:MFS family permease